MLNHIEIKNVALMDEVIIDFGHGLNILTGETGAGKSIIIDTIGALTGERFTRELIRDGSDKASVEALFTPDKTVINILGELGIEPDEDGSIIISRGVTAAGRNICRINGTLIPASALRQIGGHLADIHGQFENQSLFKPQNHMALLDEFSGPALVSIKDEYRKVLTRYKDITAQLAELNENVMKREQRKDMLSFQTDEITKAAVHINEDEELTARRDIISNSEKIMNALSAVYERISAAGGRSVTVLGSLNAALSELRPISKYTGSFGNLAERLEAVIFELEDVSSAIRDEKDRIEYDPAVLESIEERLDLLFRLKRKYGRDLPEVLEYCHKAETELAQLSESGTKAAELERLILDDGKLLEAYAARLHAERLKAASILERSIGDVLDELDMKNTRFKVELINEPSKGFHSNGCDYAEFLISPNPGEGLKSLSKIASGGEMSRIMLAIKTILAAVDRIPTLIFDEIDNGIGGRASSKVGEKLGDVASGRQVICVTHLAQIACMADHHFIIEKNTDGIRTYTTVRKLSQNERINEVARLLDGASMSAITIRHAEEMLENAFHAKKSNIS